MLVQIIPKRFTLISICHKSYSTRCLFVLSSCSIFFSYVNELPLFQFSVISFVLNEVICFSTFFHTFKNCYSPDCWTFRSFRLCVCQKLISVLFTQDKPSIVFFFSVEILSNWQSIFSSFSTFKNWKPRSKHRRSSAIMADRRNINFCVWQRVWRSLRAYVAL